MKSAVIGLGVAVASLAVLSCILVAAVFHQYRELSVLHRRVENVQAELQAEIAKRNKPMNVVMPIDPPPPINYFNR